MTKIEMFNEIRKAVADNSEMVAFIDHEIEILKTRSASKKPTKTQQENAVYKEIITDFLKTVATPKTIKEIQEAVPEVAELSNQKMSALLTALNKEGLVGKSYTKKVPHFFSAI